MKSLMNLVLAGGDFGIRALPSFAEEMVQTIRERPFITYSDDSINFDLVETGDFEEELLQFTKARVKAEPIYNPELFVGEPKAKEFISMAINHFAATQLKKIILKRKIKSHLQINGDCGLNELNDASIEWAKQNGPRQGTLVILGSHDIALVDASDFSKHLVDVSKRNQQMVYGAVFCKAPFKIIRASFSGRLVLG